MTKPLEHVKMTQYLRRRLMPLAICIALLIAVLAPVTFWLIAHSKLQRVSSLYAEDLSDQIRQIAQESPSLWKYQSYKFMAITEGFHHSIDVAGFRILDETGEPIAERNFHRFAWEKPNSLLNFIKEFNFTMGTAPIMFNNRLAGTVEVLANDIPIVRTVAILFCLSSLTGIALALLVYCFPVAVVREMEGEIDSLISDLKQNDKNIRTLNIELEQRIEKKTGELINAQEELVRKEKLAILGQLSGSVGHELRNPLGVMSNAVFFLKMVHENSDEKTKEYLEIIKQEIDNSQRIITDLLDFARTNTPQPRTISVSELINRSIDKCVIPATVSLQTGIPDSLPLLRIDPLQLEQVFQNLITNAIQAMPNGGTLRIKSAQWIDEGLETGDFVAISIEDTGEGISAKNMNKLFQPLFTTKAKGIGLGLVVCRNLVEANGGRIGVESLPGEGTTFTVIVPVKEECT